MCEYISFDDLLVKHLITFEYDVSDSIGYEHPHYLFTISDSIHYKSLELNDYKDYLLLIINQKEHSLDKYLELINNFKECNLLDKISITWDSKYKKYIVIDGCHRLSIIKYKKLDKDGKMPIEWFKINK